MGSLSDSLGKLHPDIIRDFRKTGKSNAIPQELQLYIRQLDRAVEIYNIERNISKAAKMLAMEFDGCIRTCKNRIYDAINYFHLNSTVTEEAWCNLYADYFEDLSKTAKDLNDITEARRCAEKAAAYRIRASQVHVDPDLLKPKDMLISPEVTPERLGLKEFNLKQLWMESNELINKMEELDARQKSKLRREAALSLGVIEDIDHEEVS